MLIFCGIKRATKNAMIAMLHQGKNMPARKLKAAVNNIERINLMVYKSGVSKC